MSATGECHNCGKSQEWDAEDTGLCCTCPSCEGCPGIATTVSDDGRALCANCYQGAI
jgi:hypothetical protein